MNEVPSRRDVDVGPGERRVPLWVELIARWFDDAVKIPGTELRVGLDALLGLLVPGAGDAFSGVFGFAVVVAAWRAGAPTVVLARMVMNMGIDALVGAVPVAGDIFDLVWRSNRKNVELLKQHTAGPRRSTVADIAIVGAGVGVAVAMVALPIAVVVLILKALSQ